jgi:hypothetical protein
MIDHKSEDQLTNTILKAIIRRTAATLDMLELEHTNEYDGKNFIWNMDDKSPTMTIDLNDELIFLWWNKKYEVSEMEVYSNISKVASSNLEFFVKLEETIFGELAELRKEVPLRRINLEDFANDEFELSNIEKQLAEDGSEC